MKKVIFAVSILFCLLLFSTCKKNDHSVKTPTQPETYGLSSTINGVVWKTDWYQGTNAYGAIIISGRKSSDQSHMVLKMPSNISPGTYTVNSTGGSYLIFYIYHDSINYISDGQLVIDSVTNNKITGSFHGTLSAMAGNHPDWSLTMGSFIANYQAITPVISADITDPGTSQTSTFTSSSIGANFQTVNNPNPLQYWGTNSNGDVMDVFMPINIDIGTYALQQGNIGYFQSYAVTNGTGGAPLYPGNIVIESIIKDVNLGEMIMGSFDGRESYPASYQGIRKTITNGFFMLTYP